MIGRRAFASFVRASAVGVSTAARAPAVAASAAWRRYATLGELVRTQAENHPRRELVKVPHQDLTWDATDLKTQTEALACGLLELGYTSGSKLAVWVANEAEHLCAVLASAQIGVQVVSIDATASVDAVLAVLKEEGCRGLMFAPRFGKEHRLGAIAGEFDLELTTWGDSVNVKSMRKLRHLINTGHEESRGIMQYKHFPVYDPMPNPLASTTVNPDDALIIPYTASSDGATATRGAPLSQTDLLRTAKASATAMGLSGEDVVCASAYFSSRFGLAAGPLAALHAGAKVLIPSREEDAAQTLATVAQYSATAVVASATSFTDAPAVSQFNVSSVRTGLVAGSAAPPGLSGVQAVDADLVQSGANLS